MVLLLLGLPVLMFAAACGIAVYRTGKPQPVFRALATFGLLLVTPIVVFSLLATVLTSDLSIYLATLPVALLGVGVYIIAEGTLPIHRPRAG